MPKLPTQQKAYLGVDPGKSGGLAVIRGGEVAWWYVMPDSDFDLFETVKVCIETEDIQYCHLERVHSMPGEGHVGVFSFGENYGKIQMALTGNQVPYEKITPRTWQKGVGVKAKLKEESKPQFKERLRQHAQQLFPSLELWRIPRTLTKQRAVCDAILLAEYCRRKQEGLL